MKKIFVTSALAALSSSGLFAVPVACTPVGTNQIVVSGAGTTATFQCNPSALANNFAGDGLGVSAIRLAFQVSGQIAGGIPGQPYGLFAMATNNAGLSPNPSSITATALADSFGGINVTSALSQSVCPVAGCPDVVSSFLVTITAGSPFIGFIVSDATATVQYEAIPCPAIADPEPSTVLLLGSALASVAVLLRRRR